MTILPLSYLRWSLYRIYLWAKMLRCGLLASAIIDVFEAFEDAWEYDDDPIEKTLQATLIEQRDACPRGRLTALWFHWILRQSARWRIVGEPACTPYLHFKRVSHHLRVLALVARLLQPERQNDYAYAARLLRFIPSSDQWLYETLAHQAEDTDFFWPDMLDILFPLAPEHPLLTDPDTQQVLVSLLRDGEKSPFMAEGTPAPLGGRRVR